MVLHAPIAPMGQKYTPGVTSARTENEGNSRAHEEITAEIFLLILLQPQRCGSLLLASPRAAGFSSSLSRPMLVPHDSAEEKDSGEMRWPSPGVELLHGVVTVHEHRGRRQEKHLVTATRASTRLAKAPWALLATLILAGHAVLSPVAWLPEFVARLEVSYAAWGAILGVSAAGAIGALTLAPTLLLRFGSRPVMRITLVLAVVFLVSLGLVTEAWIWALANTTFTFFFTLFGNAVNTQAVLLQGLVNRPIVGRVHAGWVIGAVAAAGTGALATVTISAVWYFAMVAVVSVVAFEFLRPHLLGPEEDGHETDRHRHVRRRFWQMPGKLWVLSLGLAAAAFPEFAIVDWAAIYATEVLEVPLGLRVFPFAAFMAGMIAGRLSMTALVERYRASSVASWGAVMAGVAMVLAVLGSTALVPFSPIAAVMVLGIGWWVVGVGLGVVAPTLFAQASSVPTVSTAWALSRMQLIAQFSMVGLKSLMGVFAESTSVSVAFLLPAALIFASALFVRWGVTEKIPASSFDSFTPATGSIILPVPQPQRSPDIRV